MRAVFYTADKTREELLGVAFCEGLMAAGDTCSIVDMQEFEHPLSSTDIAVVVGVKGESKRCLAEHLALGKQVLYLDKGYLRIRNEFGVGLRTHYIKVSVGNFNPTRYLMRYPMESGRWEKICRRYGLARKPWQDRGDDAPVLLVGSSQKYADFHDLGNVTEYCAGIIRAVRKVTKRPVVYRPKPRWKEAVPIDGAQFSCSPRTLEDELLEASATVVFGSGAAVYSILEGVPVVDVAGGVAAPVSLRGGLGALRLEEFTATRPDDGVIEQWLANLAYCQWTLAEMASGVMWKHLRKTVLA